MKKRLLVYLAIIANTVSCTSFQEEDVPDRLSVSVTELSYSKAGENLQVKVSSGTKWDVTSSPDWVSLQSISSGHSPYEWTVNFSASANDDYNREGSITIKAGSDTAVIPVTQDGKKGKYIAVESVSLSPTELTLTEGETASLNYTISPANASIQDVVWRSNASSVATVTAYTGQIEAIAEGKADISVTTSDGNKTAICAVMVKAKVIPVTGVSLDWTSLSLTEGETYSLVATVTPSNATNKSVTWSSSNTTVATVSSSGVVTAKAAGSATITVKTADGSKTATCAVTVKAKTISVTGVSLNKTSLTMTVGDTQTLTATVTPSNASNKSVTWSTSNTSVATVSSSGVVTAKAAGSATITVKTADGSKMATCAVTVKAKTISVTGVSLNITSLTMTVGDTQTLTATVTPSNATDKSVTWSSSNTSVATVSSSGVVTAKSVGSVTITVTTNDGGKKAICSVTVQAQKVSVTGVSLNKTSLSMTVGDTQTLTATVTPSNATDKSVNWSSSNTSVATVTSSGVVTAKAVGTTTIIVSTVDGGKTATCAVTVQAQTVAVTGVSLSKTSLSMTVGDTQTLTATVTPSNATDKSVTWSSSNTSLATVSSSGVVTAKAAGSTIITVTTNDGGKKATCSVTVSAAKVAVTGVSLNKTNLAMTVGDTLTLTATVTPSNATNKSVTWSSSNTSVATVSSSGVVTAKAAGTTTITVITSDGNKTTTCYVTVQSTMTSYNVALDKYMADKWNSSMTATYFTASIPTSSSYYDFDECVFVNSLNHPFQTRKVDNKEILLLDSSITEIEYFFCQNHRITGLKVDGKSLTFIISSDGQVLSATNGNISEVIAYIDNNGDDIANSITLNKESDFAKKLLNTNQLFVNIGAKGFIYGDETIEVPITFNGQDHFRAEYVRPVTASPIAANAFYDAVELGNNHSYVCVEDFLYFYDWTGHSFTLLDDYAWFYGPLSIMIDDSHEDIYCDMNGVYQKLPSNYEIRYVTIDEMRAMVGEEKVEYLRNTIYGYIVFRNNGSPITQDFNIFLHVSVSMGWGVVFDQNVTIPVHAQYQS